MLSRTGRASSSSSTPRAQSKRGDSDLSIRRNSRRKPKRIKRSMKLPEVPLVPRGYIRTVNPRRRCNHRVFNQLWRLPRHQPRPLDRKGIFGCGTLWKTTGPRRAGRGMGHLTSMEGVPRSFAFFANGEVETKLTKNQGWASYFPSNVISPTPTWARSSYLPSPWYFSVLPSHPLVSP